MSKITAFAISYNTILPSEAPEIAEKPENTFKHN